LEKPKVWSCSSWSCSCTCQYDAVCETAGECQRDGPWVVLSPLSKSGNAGDTLTYDVSVQNYDSNCDPSTFDLTPTCPSGWPKCSLTSSSLEINAGESATTTLTVQSSSNAPRENYNILVTAYDSVLNRSEDGTATYQVLNNPPSVRNFSADATGQCFVTYPPVYLSWEFSDLDLASGDYQSAYQVEIFSDPGYTNLVNRSCDGSPPANPNARCETRSPSYSPSTGLSFDATYYWRVRVWDSEGALSDCGQPEGWCYPEEPSFRTEKEWPWPDFSVTPLTHRVHLKERVEFTDESTCYDGPCNLSPTAYYLWEFGDGGTSPEKVKTSHVYSATGNYDVTLTITDGVGECTSSPITITVTLPLPGWKEIAPF